MYFLRQVYITNSTMCIASHRIILLLIVVIISLFLCLGYIDVDQWVNWVLQLPGDEITKLTKFTILPAEMGTQTPHSRWEINLRYEGVLLRSEGWTNRLSHIPINNGPVLRSEWTTLWYYSCSNALKWNTGKVNWVAVRLILPSLFDICRKVHKGLETNCLPVNL